MHITKQTLDDLTFDEYLKLLHHRGFTKESDKLLDEIPELLEEPFHCLAGVSWGIVQDRLRRKADAHIAKVLSNQQGFGDEVMLGAGVDPKEALSLMKQNDFAWNHFKTLQSLQFRK